MNIDAELRKQLSDNHTLVCILAEALVAHGVSEIRVTTEQAMDFKFRHVTITITDDLNCDAWVIRLRDRRHETNYAEYEIVKDPEVLPTATKLLPP